MFSLLRLILPVLFVFSLAQAETSTTTPNKTCPATLLDIRRSFSPHYLYEDKSVPVGLSFFASNELDWHLAPIDTEKTDLVLGFGTNSAWDIAVRKDAEELIVADWNSEPLKGQEFLMTPFILEARTPGEFISFLAGVALPESLIDAPIEHVFTYINLKIKKYSQTLEEERDFLKAMTERFRKCQKCSYEQQRFITSYYEDLFTAHHRILAHQTLSELQGPRFAGFEGPEAKFMGLSIYHLFEGRYNPITLVAAGADAKKVLREDFSIVSSPKMFKRLQRLFDGHVHFVRADALNPDTYDIIRVYGQSHGFHRYTVSLTNILDTTRPANPQIRIAIYHTISQALGSHEHPVHLFETRKSEPPHSFLHEILNQ